MFDRGTGDTHALDQRSADLFVASLEHGEGGLSAQGRAQWPSIEADCAENEARALTQLEELGLVVRARSRA